MGRRVLGNDGPVNWSDLASHARIRGLIAELIPGFEPLADIDRTRQEFHIRGRRHDTPIFSTHSGKARFHAIALPKAPETSGRYLRMMTVRSEGQFNTVVYEESDVYRAQDRRDVILMSPADMKRWGLVPDQRVTVRSSVGELRHHLVRTYDVRPGNAVMYYPEANVLVPRDVDPQSKTPAFKSVLVEVIPEPRPDQQVRTLPLLTQQA